MRVSSTPLTGIEVREIRGVGWSVVTTWAGDVLGRYAVQPDRERMNRLDQDLLQKTEGTFIERYGVAPYLKLEEARDGIV